MTVMALGLDHTTAALDIRGRFAFAAGELAPALRAWRDRLQQAAEVAIVSTCNRTELYVGGHDARVAHDIANGTLGWLADTGRMDIAALQPHIYQLEDAGAARHAFRLASGLSSMVVGETQILGQLKHAVQEAGAAGTLGTTLHQLFQRSFAVAKEVRTGTGIGMHTVSLAAAVVHLAGELFEDFGELNVLFLGAGEMAGPVLAHVAGRSPKRIVVANRSIDRGEVLAAQFGAEAIGLPSAVARLAEFDVVISCTASPLPLIGLGAVQRALKARRRKPMLMVDLAVPRDIEPEVAQMEDVYLYSLDDLSRIVQAGNAQRMAAVGKAETIIESGVQQFVRWLGTRETVPLILALQSQADAWRTVELQRARRMLARGDDVGAVLEALSRGLTQKMLHGPMAGLQSADVGERAELGRTLSRLFLRCPMRAANDASARDAGLTLAE